MFRTPAKTSVFKDLNKAPPDTISFAPELLGFIKTKKKYRTYRYADDKYSRMRVGDTVNIRERGSLENIGRAVITGITGVCFSEIPARSAIAHESYRDKEHQRQVISGYYAFLGRQIRDDDRFFVIDFCLL